MNQTGIIDQFVVRYFGKQPAEEELRTALRSYLSTKALAKGEYLVQEGSTHHYGYFLVRGTVRSFYLKDGTEVNTWFAFDGEIVGSFQNYLGKPSRETLQAIEVSEVIAIDLAGIKAWANTELRVSNFMREVIEEYTLFLEEKLLALQMDATERYRYLIEREPEVVQKVSLTYIASYLGISRETLSRIRAKFVL